MIKQNIEDYFMLARERYMILQKRRAGEPWPWSEMPVFQKYNLCNVHREDDRTTIWFRDNIRSKVSGLDAIKATVIFRWFNRIETGEIIKDMLVNGRWNRERAEILLEDVKPVVTGAYMIKTITGMDKLHGALTVIDEALPYIDELWSKEKFSKSLQGFHEQLMEINYMGGFMAYEVVSDLRWTDVLKDAPDIMTWANAGPGCMRGLSRLLYGSPRGYFSRNSKVDQDTMNEHMNNLLDYAQDTAYWPSEWRQWEMREVEHWLCEYSKITGYLEDKKEPKRVYRRAV
jgi:hypothetical protein